MTGARQRRAYRTALRRIIDIKIKLETAYANGDELTAALAHAELIDLEHEARLIEDVARVSARAAR